MEFKDRLKELRAQRNISQAALAERLGMSKSTIGMYETGSITPSYDAMNAMAEFFCVDINYLLGNDSRSTYHMDPEFAYKAQQTYIDERTRILLDVKDKLSDEDIDVVVALVKALMAK